MKKTDFGGCEAFSFGTKLLQLQVITMGATVYSIKYKGRELALNYPSLQEYLEGCAYIGAAIGRYANRIGGSKFSLNGKSYDLLANEGSNQLHGGPTAFDKRIWNGEILDENAVRMSIFSPDGDNGFPGNLKAAVTYRVEESTLRIEFEGTSDADTVYAPTSHLYFDLDGSCNVLDHEMYINSSGWLEVDKGLIPTGRIMPTEGKFDFGAMRRLGEDYDHCFVLKGEHACTVRAGGIQLDVHTDFPALQMYTAFAMGAPHGKNAGLAIEPEFYPDSPNKPQFPSTLLKAGEHFRKYASYTFSQL